MAFTKSGWYVQSLIYSFAQTVQTGTPAAMSMTGNDAHLYMSLLSNAGTDYTSELATGGTTSAIAWTNTHEVTGTAWATGGVLLSTAAAGSTSVTTTFAQGGSGPYYMQYSWTNALSVPSTTITGAYGGIIYYHDITSPVSKPMLLLLCFGAPYQTANGTFSITPSGSGLSQLTFTA